MNIKLKSLDMTKSDKHNHPDLNTKDTFLCLIGGEFFVGKFTKQWYGFNFMGWIGNPNAGLQFDAPGTNCSRWEQIWKIQKKTIKRKALK
jgi:hypothetical protein